MFVLVKGAESQNFKQKSKRECVCSFKLHITNIYLQFEIVVVLKINLLEFVVIGLNFLRL